MEIYLFNPGDLDGEVWANISYSENDYQISNFGHIKSSKNGKIKILRPFVDKDGYLNVVLSKNGKTKIFKVHRLVASAFVPNPQNKPQINNLEAIK